MVNVKSWPRRSGTPAMKEHLPEPLLTLYRNADSLPKNGGKRHAHAVDGLLTFLTSSVVRQHGGYTIYNLDLAEYILTALLEFGILKKLKSQEIKKDVCCGMHALPRMPN